MRDWNMNQINANAPTPDEIMELVRENERLKEELLRQAVFMSKTADKLEEHRHWKATVNVLRRPTREAKQALDNFAIEQQIKALDDLSIGPNNESEDRVCRIIEERIEQLRNIIDSNKT